MPFTLAHPAAVLPFMKRYKLNVTALILGSMAPDFEYFVRFKPLGLLGHGIWGFLWFNLPLCFLLAYLIHFVVKKPFVVCLPGPLDEWYAPFADGKWGIDNLQAFWIFVFSALLGMVTHVCWDSFTHVNGWMVRQIPLLSASIPLGTMPVPVFKVLQHGSTLTGLAILAVFCYRSRDVRMKVPKPTPAGIKGLYCGGIIVTGVALSLGLYLWRGSFGGGSTAFGMLVITFINGLMLGMIACSLVYKKAM